ncbi:RNA polymerase Rpb1 C-terminal repeat domain-containing protein [Geosmithia morbida]|uniref:RNA polymerase Rpb1 C-terminal repeat domain-containing protein n=1 Tax=Geosmithia morbida TaxID=1094350 RepID=A0A9P5D8N8_9HYPO|nr:RNA polymerase Rpb1 C-terminal repeat domain-containing protein [Geosmithia morbida]KAF4126980.1 RNA polymerase Rpb1 C-terminal repeat domain-containing protein [Geosmithia morbida]
MPDPKAKPTTTNSKGPNPKAGKQSSIWSLICLAREVAGDTESIQDFSDLIDQNKRLQSQLRETSDEVSRLTTELKETKARADTEKLTLMTTFGERYTVFAQAETDIERYRKQADEAKAQLRTAQDDGASKSRSVYSLQAGLRSAEREADKLRQKNKTMETSCIIHSSQLQAAEAERDDLRSELKGVREELGHNLFHEVDGERETTLRHHLKSLSDESHTIAKDFISHSQTTMTPAQRIQALVPELPLLVGTSKEAILMRRAAGQAIICQALMEHIFLPFYISKDLRQAADQMLDFFDEKEKQMTYRYQITKLLIDEDVDAAVEDASTEVCRHLDRLVPSENEQNLHRRVTDFLIRAANIWKTEGQTAADLLEITTPNTDDEGVETYAEFGERSNGKAAMESHKVAATLFPRIKANGKILHGGTVVWSDSSVVRTAKDQAPSTGLGRNGTFRKNSRHGRG